MNEFNDLLKIVRYLDSMEDPSYEKIFSGEEDCPYGEAAFGTIKKGITIYREEVIQQQMPDEVHYRLHRVIRKRWISYFEQNRKKED